MPLRAVASADVQAPDQLPELINWESKIYQMEVGAALDAGFTVGSIELTDTARLLVMDMVRSVTVNKNDMQEVWGCGYRFLVEVSDIKLTGKLTLPAIAGAMEVTDLQASIRLEVKGYTGDDLWDVMPVPKPLNVDTYRDYMAAAGRIQKAFGAHPNNAKPVLLATDSIDMLAGGITDTDLDSAVLVVWSLQRITDGKSLDEASAIFARRNDNPLGDQAAEVLAQTYHFVLDSIDGTLSPNPENKTRAAAVLSRLR